MSDFACGCSRGSRDEFVGVITRVMTTREAVAAVEEMKGMVPEDFRSDVLRMVSARGDEEWTALVEIETGKEGLRGQVSIAGEMFPQTEQWARRRIGRRLRFVIAQAAGRDGLAVDVSECLGGGA